MPERDDLTTESQKMKTDTKYQQCANCILDTNDDPKITFDNNGVCSYCNNYINEYVKKALTPSEREKKLRDTVAQIKESAKGKKYDCIMGLSGGVDSSYLAYIVKELKLNPLLVHFDNGWNSELAVKNIEGIINKTGFDLFTYVVNWDEFKDLQLSYIKAGVLDWEIPTDHGFYACLFEQAHKHKIKYILTGHNHQTEAILPDTMRWSKMDVANIKAIHSAYGTKKLRTFPMLDFFKFCWYMFVLRHERINLLELLPYDKEKAKEVIIKEFGWTDYGGKHYESIFTRFYQGYVLRKKFGFDKRKAHLSNLILSGQITRAEALDEIIKPSYDPAVFEDDFKYVAKKFDFSPEQFGNIIAEPPRSHLEFKSYETGLYVRHRKIMTSIRPLTKLLKKLVKK